MVFSLFGMAGRKVIRIIIYEISAAVSSQQLNERRGKGITKNRKTKENVKGHANRERECRGIQAD